jgi:hypothetical protein
MTAPGQTVRVLDQRLERRRRSAPGSVSCWKLSTIVAMPEPQSNQRRAEGANVVVVRAAVRARSRNERLCLTVVAIKVSGCRLVLVISGAV